MYKWLFHIGLALCLGLPFLTTVAQAEGEDDPLWNKPSYEKKIIQIGQRILKANHIQEQIEFHYIPKDVRNAAAAHSGQPNTVYVWKDMLDVISSDDELAAILSHEIAHIMKRHQGKALARKIPVRIGGALLAGTLAGVTIYTTGGLATPLVAPLVKTGVRAVEAPMQRSLEREADLVGLDYLVNAGYNPLAMETIFRNGGNGDAGPFTRMFLDHPVGTKRLAYIHEAIQQKYPQFLQDSSPQQKPADIPADASVHVVEQLTAEQSATTVKEEKATVVLETAASEQGEPVTPVSGETKDLLRNTPEVAQKNIPVETTEKAVPIDRDSKVGITQTVAESRSQPTNPEEAMRTVTKAPAVNQKVNPKKENVPASQAAIAALSVQERVNHQRNTVSSKMAEEPS
ncbi:MAG TPA: M48 family metalloprotease, partial [Oculatellaceae cyanobacterium]